MTPSPRQTHILLGKEAVEVDSHLEGILWRNVRVRLWDISYHRAQVILMHMWKVFFFMEINEHKENLGSIKM